MEKFITRIRLEDASWKDLEKLEAEMKKKSFNPVKNREGEYRRQGNRLTIIEVAGAVYNAARNTGKAYSFTIIKEHSLSLA